MTYNVLNGTLSIYITLLANDEKLDHVNYYLILYYMWPEILCEVLLPSVHMVVTLSLCLLISLADDMAI